ncbi:palmitoyl-protein thioesterase 1 precursor [Westerdykella ornata]|uniref:Palmitoyl-protein thioesterase 1 n=1 Tax=Westerdykella ornata TaxID=318751 RepID=A0A6A6JRM7_WESOR|nr:palmitoyl-protein thioesterase 1 precursor [Westerdykella ornata]KAF2279280.1 palmitoyl-protein thioesterase 1 precursor [Westerdykella ornata]
MRYHHPPFSTLLLLVAQILASPTPSSPSEDSSSPLPLIIWHGLGDNYASPGLTSIGALAEKTNPGTFTYYIRIDPDPDTDQRSSFLGDLNAHLSTVCADLAAHPILSTAPAVNALGFSQGGQFLRAFVERCNVPPVRNLVTYGSQHNGIHAYQACGPRDFVCKAWIALLRGNTWSPYVQTHVVPAQYFRSTDERTGEASDEYLENSNFLADVNNERPGQRNETYRRNLASLENFVMVVFEDDETVIPKESGWFAQVNVSSGEVTPLRERRLYEEDWLGLRELDERGGLVFRTVKGGHMELDEEDLEDVFRTYFGPVEMGSTGRTKKVVGSVQGVFEL